METVAIILENKIKAILPKKMLNGGRWFNKDFVRDNVTIFPETKNDVFVVIYDKKIKLHHLWIKTEKCVLTLG